MCEATTQLTEAELAEHVANLDNAIDCAEFYKLVCEKLSHPEPTTPQLLLSECPAAEFVEVENIIPTEGASEKVAAAPMITSTAIASGEGAAE
jgi:hypothetical protein